MKHKTIAIFSMICSLCIGLSLVGTGSTAFGDGRAFTRDSNAECYRPAGRGVYSKDTNRTYLVYLNEGFLPWIRYYDHTKNVWSDAIRVSSDSGSSRQPDHLYPSMWIDIDGYLHVVYGAHGRAYRHSVSHKPEDPSSWRVMPTIGTDQCYPQPVWSSDNELYLFSAHYYRGMSKARRELGYFKSTDGGKTFGENKIIIEHAPDGSEYVGTIKHEPAHGENPEKFHIAWVFNGHDGHMYPVYYCWMDPGNLHLYNAAGDDLGTQITYEEWGACVAATPQLDKMQMQHIPNAYVTRNGDPFVIWLEEDNKQMCSHFSRYDADEGEWVTSQILSEPDTESRCTDIDVLDDGTICLYYPGGDWVKVVTSQDDGETWQADTIYESDRIGALYFASLIDSGEMGSHARRHPDFQLTFKQWHRSNRGGKHYQFAWGKKGFLGCPRREEKEGSSSSSIAKRDVYQIVNPGQVKMKGLLGGRMDTNRENRLGKYMTEEWLLQGFRNRPGTHPWIGEHVGKWLHASTLALENKPDDQELREKIERIANGLMECQMEDGYLGTYDKKWRWGPYIKPEKKSGWDVWAHKYVLIGLLSYYETTSDKKALDTCRRIGDLLIGVFGENKRDISKNGTHEGMASTSVLEPMSLLYQLTGEKKYLEFCEYVIQRADAQAKILTNLEKTRSVQAIGNQKAYEMMSNYVGLVEHWRASGYTRGLEATKLAWESIVKENLFITGAPDAHEHFSKPGTLIPAGKCTETCVQVTWVQMNWQLLRATGDPRYAKTLHHHYYNHMLAAQHSDGINWCYFTTMAGKKKYRNRKSCCGSSGPRAIALIPQIAYMTAKDKLAINLYEQSTFQGHINGVEVSVQQNTDYPWSGDIAMTIEVARPVKFDLQLLAPGFVQSGEVVVSGSKITDIKAGTYINIRREWSGKTPVKIRFDMPPVLHTRVYNEKKRYAVSRGPIVLAHETIEGKNIQPKNLIPDISQLDQAFSKGWTKSGAQHSVMIQGKKISSDGADPSDTINLFYKPFCEAGLHSEVINIWLPAVKR